MILETKKQYCDVYHPRFSKRQQTHIDRKSFIKYLKLNP